MDREEAMHTVLTGLFAVRKAERLARAGVVELQFAENLIFSMGYALGLSHKEINEAYRNGGFYEKD